MYYPKYHCELNHIEHFWCSAKKWARENCNYTLDDLRRRIPRALASVPNHITLAYFHRCRRKWICIAKELGMVLCSGNHVQCITNLLTKVMIAEYVSVLAGFGGVYMWRGKLV